MKVHSLNLASYYSTSRRLWKLHLFRTCGK